MSKGCKVIQRPPLAIIPLVSHGGNEHLIHLVEFHFFWQAVLRLKSKSRYKNRRIKMTLCPHEIAKLNIYKILNISIFYYI